MAVGPTCQPIFLSSLSYLCFFSPSSLRAQAEDARDGLAQRRVCDARGEHAGLNVRSELLPVELLRAAGRAQQGRPRPGRRERDWTGPPGTEGARGAPLPGVLRAASTGHTPPLHARRRAQRLCESLRAVVAVLLLVRSQIELVDYESSSLRSNLSSPISKSRSTLSKSN